MRFELRGSVDAKRRAALGLILARWRRCCRFPSKKRQLIALSSSAALSEVEICAIFVDPIAHPRPMTPAKRIFSDTCLESIGIRDPDALRIRKVVMELGM